MSQTLTVIRLVAVSHTYILLGAGLDVVRIQYIYMFIRFFAKVVRWKNEIPYSKREIPIFAFDREPLTERAERKKRKVALKK